MATTVSAAVMIDYYRDRKSTAAEAGSVETHLPGTCWGWEEYIVIKKGHL